MLTTKQVIECFGSSLPTVSEEDERAAKRQFPAYVFYKDIPGGRHFECTTCGGYTLNYTSRTQDVYEYDALHISHNQNALCPKCRCPATFKNDGKVRAGKNLRDCKKFAFVYPHGEDYCEIICVSYWRKFRKGARTLWESHVNTIFTLSPEDAGRYYHWGGSWEYIDSESPSELIEPFPVGSTDWPQYDCYTVIGRERLKDCFLRWSGIDEFSGAHGVFCKYLFKFCTHPQYEMLIKMGLSDIVRQSVYGDDMKRHFNWNEKGKKFFRNLTAPEIKQLCNMDYPIQALKAKDYYKKCASLTLQEAVSCYLLFNEARYGGSPICKTIRRFHIDPRRLEKYCTKQQKHIDSSLGCAHGAWNRPKASELWRDYIQLAQQLEYDLSQEVVIFPPDIAKAHDDAVTVQNALKLEAEAKKQEKNERENKKRLKKRREHYEWREGDFLVIVPPTLRDIIKEGQAMRHCVAGYCERHAKGETTILFIRLASAPDRSFVTVEMGKDDRMIQCRAYRNTVPSEEVMEFVKHYKEWMKEQKNEKRRDRHKSA